MVQISANYFNFNRQQFPNIAASLRDHLSVKKPEHINAFFSELCLKEATDKIPDTSKAYELIRFKLDWDHGNQFAYDMGLTEVDPYELAVEDEENFRYHMPQSVGTTRSHTIEMFGKEVIKCGDYPLQIRMIGDINNDIATLLLLQNWYEEFKKDPRSFLDKVIDVGKEMQGKSSQGDSFLASLPRTREGFESAINEARKRNDLNMAHCAISMIRFFHDFLQIPIEKVIGKPDSIEFNGLYNFILSISQEDVEKMCKRPTEKLEDVLKKIFPKHRDDLQLTSEGKP